MSIEKIKKYKSEINDTTNYDVNWSKIMLLDSIADYLIEQEEQKEPFVPSDSGDHVVEVGQIWRNGYGTNEEVISIGNGKVITVVGERRSECSYPFKCFSRDYELVTRDNIKEGEWVECMENSGVEHYFGIGGKYKFTESRNHDFGVEIEGYGLVHTSRKLFKPCLPPQEKEAKENKSREKIAEGVRGIFRKRSEEEEKETLGVPLVINFDPNVGVTEKDIEKAYSSRKESCSDFIKRIHDAPGDNSERIEYLEEVISRFNLVGQEVPEKWCNEFSELSGQINEGCAEGNIRIFGEELLKASKAASESSRVISKAVREQMQRTGADKTQYNSMKMFTQEDLDKAYEEGKTKGYDEGYDKGFFEGSTSQGALNALGVRTECMPKYKFTQKDLDKAREEGYEKCMEDARALQKQSELHVKRAIDNLVKIHGQHNNILD